MKAYQTPFERHNTEEAKKMWLTVPQKNVSMRLSSWREDINPIASNNELKEPPTCGTIACFGGWLPWWPYFRGIGVYQTLYGEPKMTGTNMSTRELSLYLFGNPSMFMTRGWSRLDIDIQPRHSDYQVILNRLEILLELHVRRHTL